MKKGAPEKEAHIYTDALKFVGAAGAMLALSVAVVRVAEGPGDCVQSTNDLAPAIGVTECIDDIMGRSRD